MNNVPTNTSRGFHVETWNTRGVFAELKLTNKDNAPSKLPGISSMQKNSNGFKIQHTNYDQIKKII